MEKWQIYTGLVAFAVAVLGWLKWLFGRNAQIEENTKKIDVIEKKLDAILTELQNINMQVRSLSVALWGIDGTNGLRGEVRELKEDVKSLREDMIDHLSTKNH